MCRSHSAVAFWGHCRKHSHEEGLLGRSSDLSKIGPGVKYFPKVTQCIDLARAKSEAPVNTVTLYLLMMIARTTKSL